MQQSQSCPEKQATMTLSAKAEADDANPQQSSTPTESPKPPNSTRPHTPDGKLISLTHEVPLVLVLTSAQFLTQFLLGQTLPLLPILAAHFSDTPSASLSPGATSWLIAAYSLTVGTFILPAGRAGDVLGYDRLLVLGFFWLAVWSAVAAAAFYASGPTLFILARAMQGIGPAFLLPNGLAVLGALYPPSPRKNLVFALFGAMAPTGCVLGSVFAALFTQIYWPGIFWLSSALGFLLGCAAIYLVPHFAGRKPTGSWRAWATELDVLGGLTGVAGLILVNFAWNQAAVVTWSSPYIGVTLALGVLSLVGFAWIETRVAAHPLLPFGAMRGDVGWVLGCVAAGWSCFGIWIYYLWQFLERSRGLGPLLAAACVVPLVPSGIAAALATGFLLRVVRPAWIMVASMAAFAVGVVLLATAPPEQTYWGQTFVSLLVIAWGMDLSFPSASIILSDAVESGHQGVIASLLNTIVNYCISLALGVAGTVEMHVGGTELQGFRAAWYLAIGLAGVGVLVAVAFVGKGYVRQGLQP